MEGSFKAETAIQINNDVMLFTVLCDLQRYAVFFYLIHSYLLRPLNSVEVYKFFCTELLSNLQKLDIQYLYKPCHNFYNVDSNYN